MKKIAAILLLAILATFVLGSCAEPDLKTDVHITVNVGSEKLVDKDLTVRTRAEVKEGASVLNLLETLIDKSDDITVELDENGTALYKVGKYYETESEEKDATYYWSLKINDKEESASKISKTYLKSGDKVEFTFIMMIPTGEVNERGEALYEHKPFEAEYDVFTEAAE